MGILGYALRKEILLFGAIKVTGRQGIRTPAFHLNKSKRSSSGKYDKSPFAARGIG